MQKHKFQVLISGEAEVPNAQALQALLSTGISYSIAVGAFVGDVNVNVAPASKVLTLTD